MVPVVLTGLLSDRQLSFDIADTLAQIPMIDAEIGLLATRRSLAGKGFVATPQGSSRGRFDRAELH
jgi:hypothetical protein